MRVKLAMAIFMPSLVCAYAMSLLAHHSVESQYDVSKIVTIQGVVTKIEWTNPHALVWVDAKNADEKNAAEGLAWKAKGVKAVKNEIAIRP